MEDGLWGLNVCVSPRFTWEPRPSGMGFGGGNLGGDQVTRVEPLWWDQCPHEKRSQGSSPSWLHLELVFPSLQSSERHFTVVSKPPSLQYLVTGA